MERYVFKTCWEILGLNSASNDVLFKTQKIDNINIENAESFIHFRHSALCFDMESLPDAVVNIVNQLTSASSNTEVHGWTHLRYGSWISLLLSVFNAGMQELAAYDALPGSDYIADRVPRDADFLALAERLVVSLFDSGRVPWLFKSLSSLLRMQLKGLQTAFTWTVGQAECSQDSPVLLLKHIVFEGRKQNEFPESWRSNILISDSIYNLLSRLMEVVDKEEKGVVTRIYTNSFIHGFPSHFEPASAALISFMLTIKDIMYTLDHFLKLKVAEKLLTSVDREVLDEILELVMMVKSDKIFGHIHGLCSYIYDSLISLKDGLQDCSFLYVWNHLEGFLKDLNSSEK